MLTKFTFNQQVTEEDIQSIKGQKVKKRFGKKSYSGDVVDYDPESKWFKVRYRLYICYISNIG